MESHPPGSNNTRKHALGTCVKTFHNLDILSFSDVDDLPDRQDLQDLHNLQDVRDRQDLHDLEDLEGSSRH